MVELPEKAPSLKILNLSCNLVWLDTPPPRLSPCPALEVPSLPSSFAQLVFSPSPNAFQLKSERELDRLKGLKLEELWLDSNPLCDNFRDQSTYIR